MIMMERLGVNIESKRKQHIPEGFTRFQFTSKRKRMSTIIEKVGQTEHSYDKRIHMKGAAEYIVDSCNFYLNEHGEKLPLDDRIKPKLGEVIHNYASQALRTIGIAYKDLKHGEGGPHHTDLAEDGVI
jgi:magnesium-transporting ATPase (P-type)